MEIKLPTGLTVTLRGMKVREQRIFSDRKLAKANGTITKLVESCIQSIEDPGPYTLSDDGALDWGTVCQGDTFAASLAIRAETYGPDYDFQFGCKHCDERVKWRVNIIDDLESRALSDDDLASFKNGNRFTAEIGGGVIAFKISVNGDNEAIARNAKRYKDAPISGPMMTRIVEIRGGDGEIIQRRMWNTWLEDLEMAEAMSLVEAMESHDCGVDTDISADCPECGGEQEIPVPFAGDFWIVKKKRPTQGR